MNFRSFVVCCAVLGALRVAQAEEIPAEAQLRMQEGYALARKGKHADARDKYLQSLAVFPSAKALANIAAIEEGLGLYADALRHLRTYMKHPAAKQESLREIHSKHIPYLESKTARIRIEAPLGMSVYLNEVVVGTAPLQEPLDVMPGEYKLRAGGRTATGTIEPGQVKDADLNEPRSEASIGSPANSIGRMSPGGNTKTMGDDRPPAEKRHAERRSVAGYAVPIALVAFGATGLVLSGVFASGSNAAKADAERMGAISPCKSMVSASCASYMDAIDTQGRNDTLAKTSLVAGGLFVAAGAAAWLLWPEQKTQVGAWLTPGGVGVSLTGSMR